MNAALPSFSLAPAAHAPALADKDFAAELKRVCADGHETVVVVNSVTACLFARANATETWRPVCHGEFDEASRDAAHATQRRTSWLQTAAKPRTVDPSEHTLQRATKAVMNAWLGVAEKLTRREGEASKEVIEKLPYLAAWRCQFAGCGMDLGHHAVTGRKGRFAYLAHIVAASKDGPRGEEHESPALASALDNFMFLCDACHRLIDKRDPDFYTKGMLREMRARSIATVRHALDSLKYPEALPLAFLGNITGQQGQLRFEDALAAMWSGGLRTSASSADHYFRQGGTLHQVHEPVYWSLLFASLPAEIIRLQSVLNGNAAGGGLRPRLAVFPMHSTSVQLLTGRLLGDQGATHVFQPRRDTPTSAPRWSWPESKDITSAPPEFKVEVVQPHDTGQLQEASLLVYLTAAIDAARLPLPVVQEEGGYRLPTVQLSIATLSRDCIQRPDDLNKLGIAVDECLTILQDRWHVERIHLIVCAPSSACVVLGQKMQARHQANFVCYESEVGPNGKYKPTIEITSTYVRELVSGTNVTAQLQL
jgi:hypothetical protein